MEFSVKEDVSSFLNNLSLVNSISEMELPLIADKYSKLARNDWNNFEESSLRRNLSNNALVVLYASLLKVKITNKTVRQIRSNFAVLVENMWETGSEGIMFFRKYFTEKSK